jgi:hypothetical protein
MQQILPITCFALCWPSFGICAQPPVKEKVLYDFEDADDLKAWENLVLPGAKDKEPPIKIELSTEYATSGKHSLKLTFDGGNWPTIRYWTNGKYANHGFMLHGDSHDYITGWAREAPVVRNRPAVLVVYEAK